MTRKAMESFRERLQEFLINNGRHLSDVIFKSIWNKIASYVLFINKRIFCVPCFVWFLFTFKMWELFLPHPVYVWQMWVFHSVDSEDPSLWYSTTCRWVSSFQQFQNMIVLVSSGSAYSFGLPDSEDKDTRNNRKVKNYSPNDTATHTRIVTLLPYIVPIRNQI